eukprot:13844199-Heterocapsa_arctica.AAC.1
MELLIISVDLGNHASWDLENPHTFEKLHALIAEGLVDFIMGGPPCSTWSRMRFLPGGPRPVRLRDEAWGKTGLSWAERMRVVEANVLMLNVLSLSDALSRR